MIFTSLLAINPDIEKFRYVDQLSQVESFATAEYGLDLSKSYFIVKNSIMSKSDIIATHLADFIRDINEEKKISASVLRQGICVVEQLPPSVLEKLDLNNIYSTSYGTIIFEWVKNSDDIFSLEIGAREIGYFIEINGVDTKQIDAIAIESKDNSLLLDLSNFLEA